MNERKRWFVVVVFAVAMAWVESAVVFFLRTMIDRIEPYQANPLPVFGGLAKAELIREFATLVMLFTVGMLAVVWVMQQLRLAHGIFFITFFSEFFALGQIHCLIGTFFFSCLCRGGVRFWLPSQSPY
ncbi:MAG: hypothetical protein ABIP71_04195 [Verrucomicrobiota bacterium]